WLLISANCWRFSEISRPNRSSSRSFCGNSHTQRVTRFSNFSVKVFPTCRSMSSASSSENRILRMLFFRAMAIPPKISSRRKQRRRCFRWPQACTKEKESQGDRGINPVLTLVLCRESPFTLFGFCASHNARRCSEAWRLILCYVLGVSNTPILLYFLISSPYHLQRVAFPTVVKFLLDICRFSRRTAGRGACAPPPAFLSPMGKFFEK